VYLSLPCPPRRYSRYLSFHFPFTHERSLLEHLRAVPWRFDQRLFKVGTGLGGGEVPQAWVLDGIASWLRLYTRP
jgi:hypothetical protein